MLLPFTSLFDFLLSLYFVKSHLVSMALTIKTILMTVTFLSLALTSTLNSRPSYPVTFLTSPLGHPISSQS